MATIKPCPKERLFGKHFDNDMEILEEFFNRDFVTTIKENHIPVAIAFHLGSLGGTDLQWDIAGELNSVASSIADYFNDSVGMKFSFEHIIMNGLFSGLYLSEDSGLNYYEIGHAGEVRYGVLPFATYNYPTNANVLKHVLLKPKYTHLADTLPNIKELMKFLRDLVQSNTGELNYEGDFVNSLQELMDETLDLTPENYFDFILSDLTGMDFEQFTQQAESIQESFSSLHAVELTLKEQVEVMGGREKFLEMLEKHLVHTCFAELTFDERFERLSYVKGIHNKLSK